jgi:hypothetical protein
MYDLPSKVEDTKVHPSEPYIVVMIVGLTLLLLWWWGSTRSRRREKSLADSRPSDAVESFITSFRPEVRSIASVMYAEFQQYTVSGKVPFRKSDHIAKTLGIDKEDLDDALLQVAKQLGCRKPTKEDDSKFRGRETFEDFVEFINYLRPVAGSQIQTNSA